MLNIRNPWGRYEWDGDYCDDSELWTDELLEEFKPVFDANDGSFWMCLEDFFMRFSSVNICQVSNWEELRLKGKFIAAKDKNEDGESWVISKFYYSFEIDDDDTELHLGLHQEDNRILGADRRSYLDISLALFRLDPDNGLEVFKVSEFVIDREVQESYFLEAGKYFLVPVTTGALLQKPRSAKNDEIKYRVEVGDMTMPHPYYLSTLNDIYRKIDLSLNGILSADELNQFGRIIKEKKFTDIKQKDFTSKDYKTLS